ncbi:diguanylate cyclase domain-containing protein [Roseateles albus]|uniref:Diguanylate cyclase n=1 Tax=Roseateles albus TaxID=2987525 RepID=A0ABT5KHV8_9BURK|nr:diguanylate cyclase [Roseateles albus]MDC8773498.1 diguanylate cyclase [Roseateles albus]
MSPSPIPTTQGGSTLALHTMLASMDNIFVELDKHGQMLFLSKVLVGFVPSEVIGKHFCTWALPQYHAEMLAALTYTFEHAQVSQYLARGYGPSGSIRWYEGRISPVIDSGQVISSVLLATDVTDRIAAEEKGRKQAELLDLFYSLPFIGMAITAPDTKRWLMVNDRLCEILGYSREELVEKSWAELTHQDYLAADIAEFNRVVAGLSEGYAMDKKFIRKDGEIVDATIDVRCVRNPQRTVDFFVATVQDISLRKSHEKRILHLANHDPLTSLPNRNLMSSQMAHDLQLARRNNTLAAILFIDLDQFKPVNDRWGHDAGDILLQVVAKRLQNCLRASDMVARMGGDEFVVFLSPLEHAANAVQVAEKIRVSITQPFDLGSQRIAHLSSSIGIAMYPVHGEDQETLLSHADNAMYLAKVNGRDRVQMFSN